MGSRLLFLISLILIPSCASYRPISQDGKTPIYPIDSKDIPKAVASLALAFTDFSMELKALEPREDELSGTANFGILFKAATGKQEDGKTVDGIVFLTRTKIRGKESRPGQRKQTVEVIERFQGKVAKKLAEIAEPVYVISYTLD